MSNRNKQINKKAQVGDTMTWIVATIIIVVTLIIFIYVSSALKVVKDIKIPDLKTDSEEDVNWLEKKISFAHLLAYDKNKKEIDEWIEGKKEIKEGEKDIVVIHYTAVDSAKGTENVLKDRGLSVQYILDRDGTVLECEIVGGWKLRECKAKDVLEVTGEWERTSAYHAGCGTGKDQRPECSEQCITDAGILKTECSAFVENPLEKCCIQGFNQRAIGIEIVNLGSDCGKEEYIDSCKNNKKINGVIWEEYPDEQIEALVELVAGIVTRNNITIDRDHIIGHEEITTYKTDPGLAFPWGEFMMNLKSKVGGKIVFIDK